MTSLLEETILRLYAIGALKFGSFVLKSGASSPVYVDLRAIIAHPDLLRNMSQLMFDKFQETSVKLIGVPYSALTLASCISVNHNVPMLLVRKEAKGYGTKNLVEGLSDEDKEVQVVILEDVMTSGQSILETVDKLDEALKEKHIKYTIHHVVVFLDREQGGEANLNARGINKVSAVTKLGEMAAILCKHNKIPESTKKMIEEYVATNKISASGAKPAAAAAPIKQAELPFEERAALCKNAFGKKLFQLMSKKKTNLCLAADVTDSKELLQLADEVGPYICMLKTHIDILEDFDKSVIEKLSALAVKHDFVLFEDRKFADIGKVAKCQFARGIYEIAKWSHLTNCHLVSGATIVKGLKEAAEEAKPSDVRGLLIIAQMSTIDANTNEATAQNAWKVAVENEDFVCGFICQGRFPKEQDPVKQQQFLYCSPGINIQTGESVLGQHYNTPEHIIGKLGSDVAIVGSGICQAKSKVEAAKLYMEKSWEAYKNRLSQ